MSCLQRVRACDIHINMNANIARADGTCILMCVCVFQDNHTPIGTNPWAKDKHFCQSGFFFGPGLSLDPGNLYFSCFFVVSYDVST